MSKDSGHPGDRDLKPGTSSDVADTPVSNGFHEELHTITTPGDKTTTKPIAPSTAGDTTTDAVTPSTVDAKSDGGAVLPDASKDVSKADQTPKQAATEKTSYVDPRFKNDSTEKIQTILRTIPFSGSEKQQQWFTDAHKEVIARADKELPLKEVKTAVESIGVLQNALEAGKKVKLDEHDKPVLSDKELSPQDRWNYHQAIAADLITMNQQITARTEFSNFLRTTGQSAESDKMSAEAIELSDKIPTDLVQRQAKSAAQFSNSLGGEGETGATLGSFAQFLTHPTYGLDKLAVSTRKDIASGNLGLKAEPTRNFLGIKDGGIDLTFGKEKLFNSDRAFELAKELRQKTIEITGKDPITSGDKAVGSFIGGEILASEKLAQVDFSKTNVYAMAEQLSGRRFEGTGKINSAEFAEISAKMFDKIDKSGDKKLDPKEIKLAATDTTLPSEERQAIETLQETQDLLQGLNKNDGPGKGVSRDDLLTFVKEQRESTERLEQIRDARAKLLFNNEFDTAAGDSKYLTQKELRNFLTVKSDSSSPLSENELKSFNYLNDNFSTLAKSRWGITRSDLADTRSESVKRVESSLWKSYYNSRQVSAK
ncbi:MAG: hypothetical protein SGJ27_06050 [Candidatus Melainabacteria bacterium]|nr:hypothetical protein [Candidatus Melainabacteria bacterium]